MSEAIAPEFERVAVEFFHSWIHQEIRLIRANVPRDQIALAKFHWHAAGMRLAQLMIENGLSFEAANAIVCHVGMQLAIDGKWPEACEICQFSTTPAVRG